MKGLKCWVKCRDCNHRDLVRKRELDRAARLRCTRCGGLVDVSENQAKVMAAVQEKKG